MARKREIAENKIKKGTFRSNRESMLRYSEVDSIPVPPEHWDDFSTQLYYILATELHDQGLLFSTDIQLLHSYVTSCWIVTQCEILMRGDFNPLEKKWRSLHLTWIQTVREMKNMGGQFGFNPVDKSKIRIEVAKKANPETLDYEEFMQKAKELQK